MKMKSTKPKSQPLWSSYVKLQKVGQNLKNSRNTKGFVF